MMQEVAHHQVSLDVDVSASNKNEGIKSSGMTSPPIANPELQNDKDTGISVAGNDGTAQSGVWGWIKSASSNQFVQKVMEKTKIGVDRMITTLDPGMTPYIKEGGDVSFIVASDEEVKWSAVRDAFQTVFGAATVTGIASKSSIAAQPVGYSAGMKGAQERIKYLRRSDLVDANQPCIAIESFIVEQLPDHWFEVSCVLLEDPEHHITLELFTLSVPVDVDIIEDLQQATPSDYDCRWSGLALTVGEAIHNRIAWVNSSDWHRAITGRSRRDIIFSAGLSLAELYKRRLPKKNLEQDV